MDEPVDSPSATRPLSLDSLPYELVCEIVAFAGRSAALALARCSRSVLRSVRPLLWQTMAVRTECPLATVRCDRLREFLEPYPDVADYVRCFIGLIGAGELTTGEEARALGRVVRLLPNLQHLDVRADSMGRYHGRIDPLLDELVAWPGLMLDSLVLRGLVYSTTVVETFLAAHPSILRISLRLTRLLIVSTEADAFLDGGNMGMIPNFLWDLDAFALSAANEGALPNATHAVGQLYTLASLFGPGPKRMSLRALDLQLRVPRSSADQQAHISQLEAILQHTPALVSLRLTGEVRLHEALIQVLIRMAPRLVSLELTDSLELALDVPALPLRADQLRLLPYLLTITLRVWGCLALFPHPPGGEQIADRYMSSIVCWRLEARDATGLPRAILTSVTHCPQDDYVHGSVFDERDRFLF